MDADAGIAGAGTTGDQADTRLTGQLAIGLRHVGGADRNGLAHGPDRSPAGVVERERERDLRTGMLNAGTVEEYAQDANFEYDFE